MVNEENMVSRLIKDTKIPKMIKIRQKFSYQRIERENIEDCISMGINKKQLSKKIKPGMRICITAGSRGISNIDVILGTAVKYCKERGAKPFIVPAMGSHGGATAEGQREVLSSLNITEQTMGCPILATMDTVLIGHTEDGKEVYIDKYAAEADGIIVINRVKAHTAFRGPYESGIMKMMTIGLGKQHGAEVCHSAGINRMAQYIPSFGKTILKNAPVMFAVAITENAFDETYKISVLTPDEVISEEPYLLKEAISLMPRIYFDSCDVLIVDEIGKNISGDGMDPNITGTFPTPDVKGGIQAQRRGILSLTEETHGNGNGVGTADVISKRLYNALDLSKTYPNVLTPTLLNLAKVPIIVENDEEVFKLCIRSCCGVDKNKIRVVRIKNTLNLEYIYISEAMVEEAKKNPNIEIVGEAEELKFNERGNLW